MSFFQLCISKIHFCQVKIPHFGKRTVLCFVFAHHSNVYQNSSLYSCNEFRVLMHCFSLKKINPFFSVHIFTSLDSSFHKQHVQVLEEFTHNLRKAIFVDHIKLVGYVKETYSAVGVKFIQKLMTLCKSVGIIRSKQADGSQRRSGTVFRVGSHFVLTNDHVIQSIAGQ